MVSNSETCFTMLSRMLDVQLSPDEQTMNQNNRVTIIECRNSHPMALKAYLYFIIHRSIDLTSTENTDNDSKVNVMIFDGQFLFNEFEFMKSFSLNHSQVNKAMKIFNPMDDCQMLIHLYEYLPSIMLTNPRIRLLVIIVNSSTLFPDLMEKINQHIFSLTITVRIIIVVDCLTKNWLHFYSKKTICQILNCRLNDKSTTPEQINNNGDQYQTDRNISILIKRNPAELIKKSIYVKCI